MWCLQCLPFRLRRSHCTSPPQQQQQQHPNHSSPVPTKQHQKDQPSFQELKHPDPKISTPPTPPSPAPPQSISLPNSPSISTPLSNPSQTPALPLPSRQPFPPHLFFKTAPASLLLSRGASLWDEKFHVHTFTVEWGDDYEEGKKEGGGGGGAEMEGYVYVFVNDSQGGVTWPVRRRRVSVERGYGRAGKVDDGGGVEEGSDEDGDNGGKDEKEEEREEEEDEMGWIEDGNMEVGVGYQLRRPRVDEYCFASLQVHNDSSPLRLENPLILASDFSSRLSSADFAAWARLIKDRSVPFLRISDDAPSRATPALSNNITQHHSQTLKKDIMSASNNATEHPLPKKFHLRTRKTLKCPIDLNGFNFTRVDDPAQHISTPSERFPIRIRNPDQKYNESRRLLPRRRKAISTPPEDWDGLCLLALLGEEGQVHDTGDVRTITSGVRRRMAAFGI